jgi:hypothetical protein
MRFMYLVKHPGSPGNPTPELMEAMHKLADREIKAGRMLDNGGLLPVQTGAQVRIADGKLSVIDGPFVEAKEVGGDGKGIHATAPRPYGGLGRDMRGPHVRYALRGTLGRDRRRR